MDCPSCGKRVAESAWICGFCDHILDPSVLGELDTEMSTDQRPPSVREERTSVIAWNPLRQSEADYDDEVPDAVILGDGAGESEDLQIMKGAARRTDGKTSTFLFYTSGSTSRIIHPDAVPERADNDEALPRTPYEDFILSQIDGERSVRDIHRVSGLAPQEVVVTILTLVDKGVVRIRTAGGRPKSDRPVRFADFQDDDEMEATQAIEAPGKRPVIEQRLGGPVPDDFDDLPSVRDFEEIIDEVQEELQKSMDEEAEAAEQIAESPPVKRRPPPIPRDSSSISGVWAPDSPSSFSADSLVEDERELSGSEEVTKASVVPKVPKQAIDRVDTKPPVIDKPIPPPTPEGNVPTDEDPPPAVLDPAFLFEVADPEDEEEEAPSVLPVGGKGRRSSSAKESARQRKRKTLEAAMKRGPIKEKDGRGPETKKKKKKKRKGSSKKAKKEVVAAGVDDAGPTIPPGDLLKPKEAPGRRASREKAQPVDSVNMLKGQKLFDQALKDKAEGNLVSARMNMKLAMTFDPTNELYANAFDELSKNDESRSSGAGPTGRSRARELYDAATEAENEGDVDRAIDLLEQAIAHAKQPPFLNRLGVILAMKKKDYERAQQLVETALDLAPGNATYERNLGKILSMAATADVNQRERPDKKGGLLGFLGRRK